MDKFERHKEPRFWWHGQNLKEDSPKSWVYARGWLHDHKSRAVLGLSWQIPTRFWSISFALEEGEIAFHVACGLFSLWINVEGIPWMREKGYPPREISLAFHDAALWWYTWTNPHEWRSTDPKWRRGAFHFLDFLLGRMHYTSNDRHAQSVEITLPEKSYPATVRLFTSTWKRPRWPKALIIQRAEIEVEGGVPVPGKGENAWDCDDDAIHGLTTPAQTVEEAVQKFVDSVQQTRLKYGGEQWTPVIQQP